MSTRRKTAEKESATISRKRKQTTAEEDESVWDLHTSPDNRSAKKSRNNTYPRNGGESTEELETSKPSALYKPTRAREWTVSMAVPGSILTNIRKPDHKTLLAGRIARAAAVFCVDELVVFDDDPSKIPDYIPAQLRRGKKSKADILNMIEESEEAWKNPDQFLFHVLSFAECPPHLGTDLFPLSPNLQWAGMLPSLDMPHHLKKHEWCQYREGVALGPVPPTGTRSSPRSKHTSHGDEKWTYVKCGLPYPIKIPAEVPEGMRVTLRFANAEQPPLWPNLSQQKCEDLEVAGVDVSTPRVEGGYYWGYTVRRANCISDIFELCPFEGGYDVSIGTSERGAPLNAILPEDIIPWNSKKQKGIDRLPAEFKHLLIVFGGVAGLEPAVATDPVLGEQLTKETAHEAFDAWVNLVQGQGSRTIRTEEAIEFGLFGLKGYMDSMYE